MRACVRVVFGGGDASVTDFCYVEALMGVPLGVFDCNMCVCVCACVCVCVLGGGASVLSRAFDHTHTLARTHAHADPVCIQELKDGEHLLCCLD